MAEIPAPGVRGATKRAASRADRESIPTEPGPAGQTSDAVQTEDAAQTNDMDRLVRAVAGRVIARIPRGSGLEMADLIQAGNIGLLQAKRTFNPESGVSLAGYAKFRIRGEMLDTVRRCLGPMPVCFTRPGEDADDMTDLETKIPTPAEHSPHRLLANEERSAILDQEVARLPDRYRTVVRMRYAGEFSLREIGAVLRVRESRACQLHQSALGRLRRALSRRGVRFLSSLM
jgi:RNA polymerase sigma factor for flagellar operon FliA